MSPIGLHHEFIDDGITDRQVGAHQAIEIDGPDLIVVRSETTIEALDARRGGIYDVAALRHGHGFGEAGERVEHAVRDGFEHHDLASPGAQFGERVGRGLLEPVIELRCASGERLSVRATILGFLIRYLVAAVHHDDHVGVEGRDHSVVEVILGLLACLEALVRIDERDGVEVALPGADELHRHR